MSTVACCEGDTLRRKDFEILDIKRAYCFIDSMNEGSLATTTSDGSPSIRVLNFVRVEDSLYFHGARSGEKLEGVGKKASFNVYLPLSIIPSYWSDKESAAPATTLYLSAIMKGEFTIESDIHEKARALQKLMEKIQPEGGYLNLDQNLPFYEKDLNHLAVFSLKEIKTSFKVKLGQNWNQEKKALIKEKLKERGHELDLMTLKQMDLFGV